MQAGVNGAAERDEVGRGSVKGSTRRWSLAAVLVAFCLMFSSMSAVADDETAAAGNGGTADGLANGGAAALGDLNSGGNLGNVLGLGNTGGGEISGGSVANATDLNAALDGGTGIADASGGEYNIAFTLDPIPPDPEPVPPTPEPVPVPPVEPFQVCVTIVGSSTTCLPGSCTGPAADAECTIQDCSTIPGDLDSPCTFDGCEVVGNTGNCLAMLT